MSHPANTNSSHPRPIAQVNPRLDKNLAAYVVAASAAGVSMLALAQPAEAKIVYTPAHITIEPRTSLPLDLNNDGVNDFLLSNWQYGHVSHLSIIQGAPANEVVVEKPTDGAPAEYGAAADLFAGVLISPKRFFANVGSMAQFATFSGISSSSNGVWKDAHNRYLGLKFLVNGETHYGWARLTVTANRGIAATLTGYAYETIPNRPIIAGKISSTEDASGVGPAEMLSPSHESATLGMLARGSTPLAIWRRDEEDAVPGA